MNNPKIIIDFKLFNYLKRSLEREKSNNNQIKVENLTRSLSHLSKEIYSDIHRYSNDERFEDMLFELIDAISADIQMEIEAEYVMKIDKMREQIVALSVVGDNQEENKE